VHNRTKTSGTALIRHHAQETDTVYRPRLRPELAQMARLDARLLSPTAMLDLQAVVGNVALTSLLRVRRRTPSAPSAVPIVQRVEGDDREYLIDLLASAYGSAWRIFKEVATGTMPSPSQAQREIERIVGEAETKKSAKINFLEWLNSLGIFNEGQWNESVQPTVKNEITSRKKKVKDARNQKAKELKRARQLEKARQRQEESTGQRGKRQPSPSPKGPTPDVPKYSAQQREKVKQRLDLPAFQTKIFQASSQGYGRHLSRAREEVVLMAGSNTLASLQDTVLSTADLAGAQSGYTQGYGPALLLESGKLKSGDDYKVTMIRRGGQQIHQAGTYSDISAKLREIEATGIPSRALAWAITARSPDHSQSILARYDAERYLRDVRALRNLLEIEKSRGPEVAVAIALEHRLALHSYGHIQDYPRRMALSDKDATKDIRNKRNKATERQKSEMSYLPKRIRSKALESVNNFVNAYMEDPTPDAEAQHLVEAILDEPLVGDDPSADFIAAAAATLRTPEYTPELSTAEEGESEEGESEENESEENESEEEGD